MEIKYEDIQRIQSSLSNAYDAMCNADFEFEDEEERDYYYEQMEEVSETLRFVQNLL